jgi:hypothetical protein
MATTSTRDSDADGRSTYYAGQTLTVLVQLAKDAVFNAAGVDKTGAVGIGITTAVNFAINGLNPFIRAFLGPGFVLDEIHTTWPQVEDRIRQLNLRLQMLHQQQQKKFTGPLTRIRMVKQQTLQMSPGGLLEAALIDPNTASDALLAENWRDTFNAIYGLTTSNYEPDKDYETIVVEPSSALSTDYVMPQELSVRRQPYVKAAASLMDGVKRYLGQLYPSAQIDFAGGPAQSELSIWRMQSISTTVSLKNNYVTEDRATIVGANSYADASAVRTAAEWCGTHVISCDWPELSTSMGLNPLVSDAYDWFLDITYNITLGDAGTEAAFVMYASPFYDGNTAAGDPAAFNEVIIERNNPSGVGGATWTQWSGSTSATRPQRNIQIQIPIKKRLVAGTAMDAYATPGDTRTRLFTSGVNFAISGSGGTTSVSIGTGDVQFVGVPKDTYSIQDCYYFPAVPEDGPYSHSNAVRILPGQQWATVYGRVYGDGPSVDPNFDVSQLYKGRLPSRLGWDLFVDMLVQAQKLGMWTVLGPGDVTWSLSDIISNRLNRTGKPFTFNEIEQPDCFFYSSGVMADGNGVPMTYDKQCALFDTLAGMASVFRDGIVYGDSGVLNLIMSSGKLVTL